MSTLVHCASSYYPNCPAWILRFLEDLVCLISTFRFFLLFFDKQDLPVLTYVGKEPFGKEGAKCRDVAGDSGCSGVAEAHPCTYVQSHMKTSIHQTLSSLIAMSLYTTNVPFALFTSP